MQNIEKNNLLPGVQIVGTGRAEDDVEALNEESDDVDGDLELAIEEEKNRADVGEVCESVERCVDICWQGEEIRLLKEEDKKILKRLREVIPEKTQLPLMRKVNVKELKETVELVNSVIHNV